MHTFYLKQIEDGKYRVLAIKTQKLPYSFKLGDELYLSTIGILVANGHRVVIIPKRPNPSFCHLPVEIHTLPNVKVVLKAV